MSLPKKLETEVNRAITFLSPRLRCCATACDTHRTVEVVGWNDDVATREAIAKYLVGLRACAVDAALRIRAELVDSQEDALEIVENVEVVDKTTARNPWIAEGMWHLCMHIAKRRAELHPLGQIIALNPAHPIAKDHGLDIVAIFESSGSIGLSIVECKAYCDNPNQAISDAVKFYTEIDDGNHSVRIRQAIQTMRAALEKKKQSLVTASFWKQNRAYLPNPHYDASVVLEWDRKRPSFKPLAPGKDGIVVMPHCITGFNAFFDSVAKHMRSFAKSL